MEAGLRKQVWCSERLFLSIFISNKIISSNKIKSLLLQSNIVLNLHQILTNFLTTTRPHLPTEHLLILLALPNDYLSVELVLLLVSLFQLWIYYLPHLAYYLCYLGYSQIWVLFFYEIEYVHSVEEKWAKSLFWGLWRQLRR